MKTLAIYALEALACSGVLLAAYAILLERHVRFGWCRAYLLASTLLAAVIPLLRIPVWPGKVIEVAPTVALPAAEWTAEVVEEAAPAVTPEAICLAVYLIGVGLVAGVMLWQGAAAQCGDHPHGAFHARAHPAADRVVLVLPLDLPLGPDLGRRVAGHRSP